MNCPEMEEKLSAYLDGETADRVAVEAHLAECASCRSALESLRAQDRELTAAFAPISDRVTGAKVRIPRSHPSWWPIPLAAAAGFLAAFLLLRQRPPTREESPRVPPPTPSIARLEIATGAVEVRKDNADWTPLATGAGIEPGAWVRTIGKAKCSFAVEDGSEIRVNRDTEIRFEAPRKLRLSHGQIYTAVARRPDRFEVQTDQATIEALGTVLDIAHTVRSAESKEKEKAGLRRTVLTVLEGKARMGSKMVEAGYECRASDGSLSDPDRVHDLALVAAWIHEILVLKGKDNVELDRRVDEMLAMLGRTKMESLYESEIRALGDHCALPLTRYIQSAGSKQNLSQRRDAARILADVAGPPVVPDMVALLRDDDAEVRAQMARGLERLTGRSFGERPPYWSQPSGWESGCRDWEEWLRRNEDTWGASRRDRK